MPPRCRSCQDSGVRDRRCVQASEPDPSCRNVARMGMNCAERQTIALTRQTVILAHQIRKRLVVRRFGGAGRHADGEHPGKGERRRASHDSGAPGDASACPGAWSPAQCACIVTAARGRTGDRPQKQMVAERLMAGDHDGRGWMPPGDSSMVASRSYGEHAPINPARSRRTSPPIGRE